MFTGALHPVEFMILVSQLPPESRFVAKAGDAGYWSVTDHLLANLIDAVNLNTHVVTAANSKRAPKPPKPFPRPGKTRSRGQGVFAALARKAHLGTGLTSKD